MINGVTQLNFPWWYPFAKWLFPIGLAVAASLWVGLSLAGIIPIPISFGMLSLAPVFFSQLDQVVALGVLAVTTGVVASAVGLMSSLLVRGLLLTTAENVATVREQNAASLEKALQVTTENAKRDIALAQTSTIQAEIEQTQARDKLLLFVGRIESLFGIRLDEEGDVLLKLREPLLFQGADSRLREQPRTQVGQSAVPSIEIEAANSREAPQELSSQESDREREKPSSSPN